MGMGISRRGFLVRTAAGAAGLAGAGALARRAWAQGGVGPMQWQDLTGKTRAVLGHGGNALVVLGGAGATLLVDVKVAPSGRPLRDMVETSGRKVSRVVNTHHHADHTGGNWVFTPDTPVLAHVKCGPRIAAQQGMYIETLRAAGQRDFEPSARLFAPTETMEGERTLDVGGVAVRLRHVGPAHTDNDVVVFVEGENVLHTGDLVFHGLHPFIDREAGATTEGWIAALEELTGMCDAATTVVPGHGDIGSAEVLRVQIAYLEAIRKAVRGAMDSGKTLEEIKQMPVPGFEGHGFQQMRVRAMAAVYEELAAK